MRKEKGITLVALVVIIIVLIILVGISINLVLGDNGIITIAKRAKENIELAKIEEETELNELYTQLDTEGSSLGNLPYDSIAKLTEFKTAIANAIDEAGGIKPDISAETTVFADNIKGILKEVTKNATATADDITEGKTAYVHGKLVTGTKNKELERLYLYHEGNECTEITGGWNATTKSTNYMLSKGYNGACTINTLQVDLSKYSYFVAELSSTGTMMGAIRLHTTNSASDQDSWCRDARVMVGNSQGYMNFSNNTGSTIVYKCSLSNLDLTKKYYVTSNGATSYASGMKIHNVWLE